MILDPRLGRPVRDFSDAPILAMGPARGRTFAADPGDVLDLAGRTPAAVRVGSCEWAPGRFGPTLRLGEPYGYFEAAPPSVAGWQGATLAIHLKLDVATPSMDFDTGLAWTGGTGQLSHYPYPNGLAYLRLLRNGRVGNINLSPDVDRADWHWLVVTTRINGAYRVYQDRQKVYDDSAEGSIVLDAFRVGADRIGEGGFGCRLAGQVREARLYDRELSAGEVAALAADPDRRYRRSFAPSWAAPPPEPTYRVFRTRRTTLIGSGVY